MLYYLKESRNALLLFLILICDVIIHWKTIYSLVSCLGLILAFLVLVYVSIKISGLVRVKRRKNGSNCNHRISKGNTWQR